MHTSFLIISNSIPLEYIFLLLMSNVINKSDISIFITFHVTLCYSTYREQRTHGLALRNSLWEKLTIVEWQTPYRVL